MKNWAWYIVYWRRWLGILLINQIVRLSIIKYLWILFNINKYLVIISGIFGCQIREQIHLIISDVIKFSQNFPVNIAKNNWLLILLVLSSYLLISIISIFQVSFWRDKYQFNWYTGMLTFFKTLLEKNSLVRLCKLL